MCHAIQVDREAGPEARQGLRLPGSPRVEPIKVGSAWQTYPEFQAEEVLGGVEVETETDTEAEEET